MFFPTARPGRLPLAISIERFRGAYGICWSGEGREHRFDVDRIDIDKTNDTVRIFIERSQRGSLILKPAAN